MGGALIMLDSMIGTVEGILGNDLTDTAEFESHLHSRVPFMNNKQLKALVSATIGICYHDYCHPN